VPRATCQGPVSQPGIGLGRAVDSELGGLFSIKQQRVNRPLLLLPVCRSYSVHRITKKMGSGPQGQDQGLYIQCNKSPYLIPFVVIGRAPVEDKQQGAPLEDQDLSGTNI